MRILRTPLGGLLLVGMVAVIAVVALAYGGTPARADTPTPIPNYPAGIYGVRLDCGTGHNVSATVTFTKDGTAKGNATLSCPPQAKAVVNLTSDWNDLEVAFTCRVGTVTPSPTPPAPTPTPAATLQVPAGTVVITQQYYLPSCPPLPGTPTPGPTTPTPTLGPGDPYVVTVSNVGGIAELPSLAGASGEDVGASAGGSGWSAGAYAALAGGLAAAAIVIVGGGWFARRRFTKS